MADTLRRPRTTPSAVDWRCRVCGGLLGRVRGERLHIRMKGCSEYVATLPCSATCRRCTALNDVALG